MSEFKMLTAALESCQAQKSDAIRLNWEYEARITNLQAQLAAKDKEIERVTALSATRFKVNQDLKQKNQRLQLEVENLKMVCRRLAVAKTLESRDKIAEQCHELFRGEITRQALSGGEG